MAYADGVNVREQWPGEEPDLDGVEEQVEEAEEEAAEAYDEDDEAADEPELRIAGHPDGELEIPDDVNVLEGESRSTRRGVGVVVARADADVSNTLLAAALAELDRAGVPRDNVTVMAVPGAFELPIGAMALAKTRRYACVVALGTASGFVAGEAASGLQLAGLETGVPVAFGVLTEEGVDATKRGAEAVRDALEMADLFQQLRSTAAQAAK
jgi:6,7-dimethyl-8-ribityllumazine synthase